MPRKRKRKLNLLPVFAKAVKAVAPNDEDEQELLAKAIKIARPRSSSMMLDNSPLATIHRNMGIKSVATTFRRQHIIASRTLQLNMKQIAFGRIPDPIREEHSAYCDLMYQGFQHRFLNRHPDEEPEEFLDRPRKATLNLTKLVINLKSILYKESPVREVDSSEPDIVRERLNLIWDDLFNLTLLQTDRMTRLLGTTSIRPMIDKKALGGIKLWMFVGHQLRVIPKKTKPWEPAVVIERHEPFDTNGRIVIWTEKTFMDIRGGSQIITVREHGMGRIPHTFFHDQISFQSFFVQGDGRSLCEQNSTINDKLSDLNEVVQMQGFGQPVVHNPSTTNIISGPRKALVFTSTIEEAQAGVEKKIEYVSPNAPITEVRGDLDKNVKDVFTVHRIPEIAVGVDLGRRVVSGVGLRAAMEPLFEDRDEREKLFIPAEQDLADNCLRVLNEYEEDFDYTSEIPVQVSIAYTDPRSNFSTIEQLKQDEADLATGVKTPADLIQRGDPVKFSEREDAVIQWKKNLEEIRGVTGTASPQINEMIDWDQDEDEGSLVGDIIRQYGDGPQEDLDRMAEYHDQIEALRKDVDNQKHQAAENGNGSRPRAKNSG